MSSIGKLYYSYGSCSSASYIAATYAGLNFESESVDLKTHTTKSGEDYYKINPAGNVPFLKINDNVSLREGSAILLYIADRDPSKKLAPPVNTLERYQFIDLLALIATEVHKGFGPLWNPTTSAEGRTAAIANLIKKYTYLENNVLTKPGQKYLFGDSFSVLDSYLYIVLRWGILYMPDMKTALDTTPKLKAYWEGIDNLDFIKKYHADSTSGGH